jgi:hypothetical protein
MIIRTPSAALIRRIKAAGEAGQLSVRGCTSVLAEVIHRDGTDLSEPEQRRVAGLVAADDAEPFA